MGLELGRDVCTEDINWGFVSIQIVVRLLRENTYKKKMNAQQIKSWGTPIRWQVKKVEPTMGQSNRDDENKDIFLYVREAKGT